MKKIIVLSDTHVGESTNAGSQAPALARFEAGVRHASTYHADAEFLIHLGDLTQNGSRSEYERVRPVLEAIDFNCHLIPGNHDDRIAMRECFPDLTRPDTEAGGFLQSALRVGSDLVLALDTLADPEQMDEPNCGYLCPVRLNWVRDRISEPRSGHVIIFMHHPPFRTGVEILDPSRLMNGDELISVLDTCRVPVHIVCGHLHRTVSGTVGRHGFSVCKGSSRSFRLARHPDCPDQGVFEDETTDIPAYNVLFLFDDCIVFHTQIYDLATVAHL